jgi:hypothetical protein
MKVPLAWLCGLLLLTSVGLAEEANGLRLTAQKTVLDKETNRDAFDQWDKVDKALGLKVAAVNTSFKDLPEGTLEYTVIVKRWGRSPELYESYTGTEKFPALIKGADANLVVGKVPMSGYEIGGNRKQFQDSIEGWQVIVKHADKETIKLTSTAAFVKLLPKAKPGKAAKP